MAKYWVLLVLCFFLPVGLFLKCRQCFGEPYNCPEREQTCFVNQSTCMSQTFTIFDGTNVTEKTFKGCSQGLVCNETMYFAQRDRKYFASSTCCLTDNCNTGTYYSTAPVADLKCLSCMGNNQTCALPDLLPIKCAGVQDRCMTVTSLFVNVYRSDTVIKACGTGNLCNRTLEYNAGKGKLYTHISCCGKTKCNNDTNSISVDEKYNGFQCYACNETGKRECITSITTVQCTGNMIYCMEAQGFPGRNILMRGCCSKDVCPGLSASLSLQASQKLYCCSGNLCNNGNVASYFSSSLVSAQKNLYLLGMTLAAAVGLGILA